LRARLRRKDEGKKREFLLCYSRFFGVQSSSHKKTIVLPPAIPYLLL